MSKHFGAQIIEHVLEMKKQGMTNRAIAGKFGLTTLQIKKLCPLQRCSCKGYELEGLERYLLDSQLVRSIGG